VASGQSRCRWLGTARLLARTPRIQLRRPFTETRPLARQTQTWVVVALRRRLASGAILSNHIAVSGLFQTLLNHASVSVGPERA